MFVFSLKSAIARLTPSRIALRPGALCGAVLSAQNPTQPLTDTPPARETLTPAPNRAPGEGFGPFPTMVVRGAMLIDGTGGPPRGPVDIVVNNNRITAIRNAGTPGVPLRPNRAPKADYEIDATGMYVMPGFIDSPRARRRRAEESRGGVPLQAVARARRHDGARRAADRQRARRSKRRNAARGTRSSRRASSTTSGRDPAGARAFRRRRRRRANG